jgi:polysaccharide pyruvyl transferase WcaK-like protein
MAKNKINIFLKGAHDSFNFGDDLLFIAIYYFLTENLKLENKLNIYTKRHFYSLDKLDFEFNVEFKKPTEVTDIIFKTNTSLKKLKIPKSLRIFHIGFVFFLFLINVGIFRITKKTLFFKEPILFFKNLNILHYIGGGYLADKWRSRILYEFLTVMIAKTINPNLKIIGTGLGLGPFKYKSSLFFIKHLLKKFDYIFVREQESFQLIKNLTRKVNAQCLGDDAILCYPILENLKNKNISDKNLIAINLKDFSDHSYQEFENLIDKFITTAHKNDFNIEYFSFGQSPGPDDCNILQNLSLETKPFISKIHNPYKEGIYAYLQSLNMTILGFGFAYHFNVILAIMSIPTLGIYIGDYYKQKIKGSMAWFNMPFVYSISELKNKNFDEIIHIALQNKWKEKNMVKEHYQKMLKEYTRAYDEIIKSF